MLAGILVAALAAGAGLVVARRAVVTSLAALLVVDGLRLYGIVFGTPTWLASRWDVVAEQWHLQAVGWGLAIAALVLHARRRRWEALAATFVAAATITFSGGVLELDDLGAPGLTSALSPGGTRAAIAVVLGLGLGLSVRAAIELRRGTLRPASP